MDSKLLRAAVAVGGVIVLGQTAHAGVLGPAEGFNAFILGDYSNSPGGDTEGRLAVGGNANLSSYSVGAALTNSHGSRDDLVVGGSLNAPWGWNVANGNAVYGTTVSYAPTTPNGTLRHDAGAIDFTVAAAQLQSTSDTLAALAVNATGLRQWSTYTITGTDAGLNVFTLDATQAALWASASDHQIIAPSGSTFIINFTSASVSMQYGMELFGVDSNHVLFNFDNATALNISSMGVLGSILAPDAHLDLNGGNINGQVVAASAYTHSGGEFHNYTFTGTVPGGGEHVVAVPSPLALPAGLAMLGGVALRRPRRSRLA